jgi:hypothetical protein
MSRWADTFAALSRGYASVDTLRHNESPPSECPIVPTVSCPPRNRDTAAGTLTTQGAGCNPCENVGDRSEAEEERTAIVEQDGGIPPAWAEGLARLDPDRPPGDVPPRRWLRFVDDVGLFLDRWAAHAASLGWGPYDLFGCDRDRPFARIDRAGLLWLLNGDHIIALSENTATIETRTGARQTYRRKPRDPGRVLAWELME